MNEQSVDFIYPDDEGEPKPPDNSYREAARHFLRVMNVSADYVVRAESKDVAVWATAYALGLAVCEGVSITDRAWQLKVSPQALSKAIKEFENQLNIPNQSYTYDNGK